MSSACNRVLAVLVAPALAVAPAAARTRGYSVEAAAGVSQGSSVPTTYDAHPYHPYSEFGKTEPHSGAPRPRAGLVENERSAQDPGDKESHPERMGIDPTEFQQDSSQKYVAPDGKGAVVVADKTPQATTAEAAANFPILVQAFLEKHGEDGVWTYNEGGRARRFRLLSAEVTTVRKLKPGVFSAPVLLRDVAGGKPVVATAVADCTEAEWRIVSLEPARAKAAAQR